MFDQAILRTGVKYGVMCALATFLVVLILFFSGANPYGQKTMYGWVLIPGFVFAGLRYFKKFNDNELSFFKGLRVAWSIAFYTALCSAMLVYVFAVVTGFPPIEMHIKEMKAILDQSREAAMQSKVFSEEVFNQTYAQLDKTTPSILAADDFVKKMTIGFLSGLVGAVLYRK